MRVTGVSIYVFRGMEMAVPHWFTHSLLVGGVAKHAMCMYADRIHTSAGDDVRVQGCIHTAPKRYPKRLHTRPKLCMHDEYMYGKVWTGFGRLVILY